MIGGETVLVMGAVEFKPLVIFSSDDSDMRFTFAVTTHLALHNSDPFALARADHTAPRVFLFQLHDSSGRIQQL